MEIWKSIRDYEGLYEVSSYGRVKSLARNVINKQGKSQRYNEVILKYDVTSRTHSSYYRVTLCKDHKTKRCLVHRLVAEAFLEVPKGKTIVNHKDNDGTNNHVDNLEWCTHSENMLHAQKQGRLFESQSRGGTVGGSTLKNRAKQKYEASVGNVYGSWKVLEYVGKYANKAKPHYLKCICTNCDETISYLDGSRLLRSEVSNCISCSLRKRASN